jgi:hypothetical protein
LTTRGQTYPSFGSEIDVSINDLTFDAMEPFVSPDGSTLFFNNLNDNINTRLYYASYVNDSTFNYVGPLNGTNQITPPHLDAIADIDSLDNFYWTSTRNYGIELETLFHGNYSSGNVTNIGRVHGDFNKNIPGWLLLDHGISYSGDYLIFCNARFETGQCQEGICESEMGIALKVNDSTFNKMINSDSLMQNVNDTNFIYYAPCITSDELELYYTRYPKDSVTLSTNFEICVAVRNTTTENFSIPMVLFSETFIDLIEAPTLTADKQIIYYHRKIIGSHKIVMRYRESNLGTMTFPETEMAINIYPNPTTGILNIIPEIEYQEIKMSVFTLLGAEVITTTNQTQIDINSFPSGAYFLKIEVDGKMSINKFLKIE